MNKIDVNGDNVDPVYKFLKEQKSGLLGMTRIKWNFEKYVQLYVLRKLINTLDSCSTRKAMFTAGIAH